MDLKHSTDKTNNGRGTVTLLGIDADAVILPAGSTLGVSISGTAPGDGVAAGTYTQLGVTGSIDLDNAILQVTTRTLISAGTTFTIVQSADGVSGTFKGLLEGSVVVAGDGTAFTISYKVDGGEAVVLTALGTKSPIPVVTGVSPATGPTTGGTLVTIAGTNLAGATAVNFASTPVTSFLSDTANQITLLSPAGTGTVDVTVVIPVGASATSAADHFTYFDSQATPTSLWLVAGGGASGGTATLTATLTTADSPLAGRTVTFTLSEAGAVSAVGTATTNANGVATLTGVSLAGLKAGTYLGAIGASFAGDSTYAGSGASGTLVVNAAQAIPTNVAGVAGTGAFAGTATLTATLTGGGLPLPGRTVAFTLNAAGAVRTLGSAMTAVNGVATLTGVSLAGFEAGTYLGAVGATFAGDSTYAGSVFSGTLVVNPAILTNLSGVAGTGTFGGTATLTATLTAGSSPLGDRTVTFTLNEGGAVRIVGLATTAVSGVATLTGVSLAGFNAGVYSGAVGAHFAGDSTYAGSGASGTLVVNTGTPPIVIREQPLFQRKTNRRGKPIGSPVLRGFLFVFSEPLNRASATSKGTYQIDTYTTKRVRKQTRRVLHRVANFSVSYSAANDAVTVTFGARQTFRDGGQLTVVGGTARGVTTASGIRLSESEVFTISRGGKAITSD